MIADQGQHTLDLTGFLHTVSFSADRLDFLNRDTQVAFIEVQPSKTEKTATALLDWEDVVAIQAWAARLIRERQEAEAGGP